MLRCRIFVLALTLAGAAALLAPAIGAAAVPGTSAWRASGAQLHDRAGDGLP